MTANKKVTLKHIAKIMGMTPATISKALRNSNDISKETQAKVKELAEQLGYRPNLMARSLVSSKSYLLGVIVPNLRISFFSEVTRGIYEQARRRGYEAIIMVNDENFENERRNLEFLTSLAVEGILINAVPGTQNYEFMKSISDRGIPFVSYDRSLDDLNFHSVTIDDENSAYRVIENLVGKGRRNILFLGPTDTLSVARGRYRGYRKALENFGIEFEPQRVVACEIDEIDANNKMQKVLDSRIPVDAVMCVGGLVAYGAGRAILNAGLSIPNDIEITEFGDNDIVARLGVPFLTVYQFPYKIGGTAVDLVVDLIEKPELIQQPLHKVIRAKLIYHEIGLKSRIITDMRDIETRDTVDF
ncbi:MAG TPA: LacI family DNA-binding transcriptional regulator [bacterium]|nr:LacI family DNA-binding transcriptional regulator [bacterium]HPN44388.1 LacI family DNA-binding transcriptional regulator [bacterium]